MAEFIQLIPVVSAQTLDTVSQPTFGNIEVSGGGGVTSSILLSSDKTAVKVGETFKVKVNIKTNNLSVSEYRVVISYDRSVLSVIDQDSSTTGTQVKLLDDVFTITDIAKNNTVTSDGTIIIDAKTSSGNAFAVNKDVAEIEFQAQTTSSPVLKIVQNATGSELVRSNGSNLTFTTNEVTIQSTAQTSTGSVTPTPAPVVTPPSTSGGNTTGSTSGGVTTIPSTGIKEDITQASGLFLGIFLIATGVALAKSKIMIPKK